MKSGLAPSNAFVLIEWGSEYIQQCAVQEEVWNRYGLDLVQHHAQVLERCLSLNPRSSLKQSALVVTRRALRALFKDPDTGEGAVSKIVAQLAAKDHSDGGRNSVLLGVVAGVCARLVARRPSIVESKGLYYAYYAREIIGSRSAVPQHIAAAFNDLFVNFTTQEDLQEEIVPAFEKALLRAPEVVLDLLPPMVQSLPTSIDFSESLAQHLLKPILTDLKSQNPAIRNGAMTAFNLCLEHSHDDAQLQKISDDILNPLAASKLNVPEQRTMHSRMLKALPCNEHRSAVICTSLASVVAKESNETALGTEIAALTEHFAFLLGTAGSGALGSLGKWTDVFVKGIGDRRPTVRKAWIFRTSDVLWRLKTEARNGETASGFVDAVVPKLIDCFDEVTANLQASVQSGLAAVVYAIVATHDLMVTHINNEQSKNRLRKSRIPDQAFAANHKTSILNHRIYTKLSGEDEIRWVIRALSAKHFPETDLSSSSTALTEDGWALAFLYVIATANVPPALSKEAVAALQDVYCSQPRIISNMVVRALWAWNNQVESMDKDTPAAAAKTANANLYLAVRSICPLQTEALVSVDRIDENVLKEELIKMLVLARPEVLPRVSWIDLCLRVGQDPGNLCRSNVKLIMQRLTSDYSSARVNLASYGTAAELAFVSPDAVTPALVEQIEGDLAAEIVRKYGPIEAAIARTPDGTTFIDVLDNKPSARKLDKNARDYETLKWEEEVRSQQAAKKGQEKKLTPDEKAKVENQLAKERKIREEVLQLERTLRRGSGFVEALATGPPTEVDLWLGPCLQALLGAIAAGAGLIVGDASNNAYLACANVVSTRLGSLRPFIGVATLRSLDSIRLPESMCQEPLGGM